MPDFMRINEGSDFKNNRAFVSGAAATTAYFLLSSKAVIAANLTASVSLPTGTIGIDFLDPFPATGSFIIGSQTITYTGKSAGTGAGNLTGCTGGTGSYPAGAYVYGTTGWKVTDTLAGGVGEVTYWTGGGRVSQTVPTSVNGIITFTAFAFNTGTHSDGPASVKSYAWVTTSGNTGVVIGVGNAQTGGAAVDMSGQNANLAITPVYFEQNAGGSS